MDGTQAKVYSEKETGDWLNVFLSDLFFSGSCNIYDGVTFIAGFKVLSIPSNAGNQSFYDVRLQGSLNSL